LKDKLKQMKIDIFNDFHIKQQSINHQNQRLNETNKKQVMTN